MRLSEEMPIDPDVLAELEAIDATLRGEAVDPAHADLAELALLLADQRAALPADAAQSLDAAVARRFEPAGAAANPAGGGASTSQRPRNARWALRPAFGAGLAGLAAAAIAAVVVLNGSSDSPAVNNLSLAGLRRRWPAPPQERSAPDPRAAPAAAARARARPVPAPPALRQPITRPSCATPRRRAPPASRATTVLLRPPPALRVPPPHPLGRLDQRPQPRRWLRPRRTRRSSRPRRRTVAR